MDPQGLKGGFRSRIDLAQSNGIPSSSPGLDAQRPTLGRREGAMVLRRRRYTSRHAESLYNAFGVV